MQVAVVLCDEVSCTHTLAMGAVRHAGGGRAVAPGREVNPAPSAQNPGGFQWALTGGPAAQSHTARPCLLRAWAVPWQAAPRLYAVSAAAAELAPGPICLPVVAA